MSGETKSPGLFTQREVEIMAVAWTCFDGEPKLNYSKLATMLGMTNERSASNAWAKIKKKLALQAAEVSGDATAETNNSDTGTPAKTPKTPKTPASKKRGKKAAGDAENDDDEATPTKKSPAKKPKKTATAKKVKKEESEEDAAEDDEAVKDEKMDDQ